MAARAPGTDRLLLRRLGWLAFIWIASVVALGVVALIFRLIMSAVGLMAG